LLLLFGVVGILLRSSADYDTTSSRVVMDSEVQEQSSAVADFEAYPSAGPPMGAARAPSPMVTAQPSDAAMSDERNWFGRAEVAISGEDNAVDNAKSERPQANVTLKRETLENEPSQEMNKELGADQSDSRNAAVAASPGRARGFLDLDQDIVETEEAESLSVNGRLNRDAAQKSSGFGYSSSATEVSEDQQPSSQSASTRAPATVPQSSLFFSGVEQSNRASRSLGERGQVEKQNQPLVVNESVVDGVANGVYQFGQNQAGGGLGGGGFGGGGGGGFGGSMGGMGGDDRDGVILGDVDGGSLGGGMDREMDMEMGMGMEMGGAIAESGKSGGFSPDEAFDAEQRFGDKLQQQGQQQAAERVLEKSLESKRGKIASAAADPFGGNAKDSKAKRKDSRGSRPSSGVPTLSKPSPSVSGPGPGLLGFGEADESGGEILQNFSKRVSGVDSNVARFKQAEGKSAVENNELAVDKIAKLDAEKAKDALSRYSFKESAKNKKLAILGKKPARQTSVPSGFAEIDASANGFSTFSLHVSDVSFKLAQAALNKGEWPDASRVRSEEFLNAFDYGDPMPTQNERVSCRIEQSIHPFLQQRNLLRVAMRTAAAGRSSSTPLRLTFLLDNSGSMERIDRQQTVRRAFAVLAQQLKPIDEVTLISFARQPRLLADRISGAEAGSLVQTIENLPSEGGTNLESALGLAFEKAQEQYQENAQNRIILLTDGAVNLGDASPERLADMIVTMRNRGIAFDAAGISADGLNDEVLEALTRKGDGRYYLLDSLESVDDGFAKQIAGALRPAAKNVKIQVAFNPERVGKYKLLGFEKHRLKKEDFRNDKVDAAEMAAAEAGVALYQVQAKPDGYGDIGTVSVRFRDLETGQMVEEIWPIPYETSVARSDFSSPSMKIATAASLFASKLKGGVMADTVDLKELASLLSSLAPETRNNQRIRKLEVMIQQARQINGN
ncbi:MAG: YfbK domain-containing protein, partial [Rubripirellula sp.]